MNPRRQLIIAAVAGVLVTALFFFFVLTPKLAQISDVREDIEAAESTQRQLEGQLARLEEARRNATRTQSRLAVVRKYLPETPDLPGFIRLVQTGATASGIDLRSIAPGPPQAVENSEGISRISVTLSIVGRFRRLEDFLTRLERLDRVVEVRSLTVAPSVDQLTGVLTLNSTLTLIMYVVEEDARLSGTTIARPGGGS